MNTKPDSCQWLTVTLFNVKQKLKMWLHSDANTIVGFTFAVTGSLLRILGYKTRGLNLILKSRRITNLKYSTGRIKNIIHGRGGNRNELVYLLGKLPAIPIDNISPRVLILKLPSFQDDQMVEKGALIIKFSETFILLYLLANTKLLNKYFRLILEPSYVGYSIENILVWSNLENDKVIVFSPYHNDYELLKELDTNLIPVTLGPADWVDTSRFYSLHNPKKIYDCVYIANFNPLKRVDRYIRAIAKVNKHKPEFRAALVCATHGTAKKEILATLDCFKGKANIDYLGAMSQQKLNELLNQSKVSVLISLREGTNKGLAEALFSGTPALLIEENVGGNHVHINEQTGKVVPDNEIEKTLLWFSENYTKFSPDEWAMENISPEVSTKILSDKLREIELSEGRKWTRDLYEKVNRPEMDYLDESNSFLLDCRKELLRRMSSDASENALIPFLKKLQRQQKH